MGGGIVAALRHMDGENLAACGHGLRASIERARLAGNPGAGDFYDALGALVDAEGERRAGGDGRGDLGRLEARTRALSNGELLTLAMHTTLDAPPGVPPSSVAFLRAVGALLNDECRKRAGR
jgi:hypothetical protein